MFSTSSSPSSRGDLQERLRAALRDVPRKRVLVVFADPVATVWAQASDEAAQAWTAERVRAGCITKLFTASLARAAVRAGRFDWDTRIADLLPVARPLAGVTVQHLLEHSHGLDDSGVDGLPKTPAGSVDADALVLRLALAPRLAEPGELYNYGNAGAWLLAAILERCYGKPYAALLAPWFGSIDPPADRRSPRAGAICPAGGGALTVSAHQLLTFLRRQISGADRDRHFDEQAVIPLPGWNPIERGIRLGWKWYGCGWFGHNSVWPRAALMVRIQPRRGIAIAVAARDHPAGAIAARLFGALLPEFAGARLPKLLDGVDAALDPTCYTGVYGNRAMAVSVTAQGPSSLELSATSRRGGASARPIVRAALRRAQDDVFFTQPLDGERFPFVQFIAPRAGRFQYLWNGRCVWRRVRDSPTGRGAGP